MPHTETARAVLKSAAWALLAVFSALLIWSALSPVPDLAVSGFFYRPGEGFFLGGHPVFAALHFLATFGARGLALLLVIAAVAATIRQKSFLGMDAKSWTFLLLGLLIGPGLAANLGLKDHWGRARPVQTTEFGGGAHYSPALSPAQECVRNCSFISGDGAFGFYLPAFAYAAAPKRSRRVFWSALLLGAFFGLSRLASGAHYLSDTLFALLFMQAILALLHGAMFGWRETQKRWRQWFFCASGRDSNS